MYIKDTLFRGLSLSFLSPSGVPRRSCAEFSVSISLFMTKPGPSKTNVANLTITATGDLVVVLFSML